MAACLTLYLLAVALYRTTGDQDAAIHAIYARFPVEPSRYLSAWARPLFAVPYLVPALVGYEAMRLTTVALCGATAWLTYLTARRVDLPQAWLAVPLTLLQPALLGVGVDTMTEPTFALALAAGFLAIAHERPALGAAILSFLPLARPEGPFVIVCVALAWLPAALRDPRRWLPRLALFALGVVVWQLGAMIWTGSATFLRDTFPWRSGTTPWRGEWSHYVKGWPQIVGWGTLVLWLAGLRTSARQPLLRIALAATLLLLVVHTRLYMQGTLGSTGFLRYFASIAPLVALVATAGADALSRSMRPAAWRAALAVLLVVDVVHAFVRVDSNPGVHMGRATLESVERARRLVPDLARRPVVSADYFGYVLLDRDRGGDALPVAAHDVTAPMIARYPAGTVVLWDNATGDWWFHLTVDDFTSRGYRVLWDRQGELRSPLATLYWRKGSGIGGQWIGQLFGEWPYRDFRQTVLVKE
jgi:hypothetical protein